MCNVEEEYPCTQHALNWNTRCVKCKHQGLKALLSLTQVHHIGYSLLCWSSEVAQEGMKKIMNDTSYLNDSSDKTQLHLVCEVSH